MHQSSINKRIKILLLLLYSSLLLPNPSECSSAFSFDELIEPVNFLYPDLLQELASGAHLFISAVHVYLNSYDDQLIVYSNCYYNSFPIQWLLKRIQLMERFVIVDTPLMLFNTWLRPSTLRIIEYIFIPTAEIWINYYISYTFVNAPDKDVALMGVKEAAVSLLLRNVFKFISGKFIRMVQMWIY